jgi:hypothetical protein
MESGHVHLDERIIGVYAYYFLVDPDSPTTPVPSRKRRYIVGVNTESCVGAFFGLVMHLNRNILDAVRAATGGVDRSALPPPPSANVSTIGDISAVRVGAADDLHHHPNQDRTAAAEMLRPWHHLYSATFGTIAFDTFCRSVLKAESTFLFCELNEEQARVRAAAIANPTGASWGQTSTRNVSPRRNSTTTFVAGGATPLPAGISHISPTHRNAGANTTLLSTTQQPMSAIAGNATSRLQQLQAAGLNQSGRAGGGVQASQQQPTTPLSASDELTRLKSQIEAGGMDAGSTNAILIERSRATVQNLSDAERSALIYKYETTRKELEDERKRTANLRETLRVTMADFEERLERLQQQSANALADAAARERHNLDALDKDLTSKHKSERDQLELTLLEKDRKLAKALARVEFLEGSVDALTKKTDLLSTEEQRAAAFCVKAKAEQERLEDENNRLRRSLANVESRLDDETRMRRQTEVAYRSLEQHSAAVKGENDKLRRDCEKFAQYSLSLHEELKALDANAIAASEMFQPRHMLQQQQQRQMQQQQLAMRRPSFPAGYGM